MHSSTCEGTIMLGRGRIETLIGFQTSNRRVSKPEARREPDVSECRNKSLTCLDNEDEETHKELETIEEETRWRKAEQDGNV